MHTRILFWYHIVATHSLRNARFCRGAWQSYNRKAMKEFALVHEGMRMYDQSGMRSECDEETEAEAERLRSERQRQRQCDEEAEELRRVPRRSCYMIILPVAPDYHVAIMRDFYST